MFAQLISAKCRPIPNYEPRRSDAIIVLIHRFSFLGCERCIPTGMSPRFTKTQRLGTQDNERLFEELSWQTLLS
jgi:hypothetical protein